MSDNLHGLNYIVQHRDKLASVSRAWESIAAFNAELVAARYANRCRKANDMFGYEYRTIDRNGNRLD